MICGFLDPKGVLYPCWKWEHLSKEEELVNEFNLGEPQKSELHEDVLLKNGWICIRSVDAYKKYMMMRAKFYSLQMNSKGSLRNVIRNLMNGNLPISTRC